MFKNLILLTALLLSTKTLARASQCLYPLRSQHVVTAQDLSHAYVLQVHKTMTGELDPFALGDGGITAASLISDGVGKQLPSNVVFILFENNESHPMTSEITRYLSKGWTFLLIKRECLRPMIDTKQISALRSIANRHMHVSTTSQLSFFVFQ